jgi:2-polyprenyl-3-methyl-5-hydroxy-6-metoxy-1,4-benzoquinol methylase
MNAFETEKYRHKLAAKREYTKLQETYNKKYPEIKNLNSAKFWDHKHADSPDLKDQDGMTKDRVKITYDFIPKTTKKLLDIGAGKGFVEELITQNRYIELYGNDISEFSVKSLKSKFKGSFSVQSIYKLKYKNDFFDTILLLEVLEHIPPSKTFSVLRKIRKLIKGHGYFILSVPLNEGLEHMDKNLNGHLRTYTKELLTAELEINGFKILNYKYLYAFPTMYQFKKLLTKVFPHRWKPNNIIIIAQKI